jgi:hypothetical protein
VAEGISVRFVIARRFVPYALEIESIGGRFFTYVIYTIISSAFEQLVYSRGVACCTFDCVVMYQYYLHSDRFERSSTLDV